MAFEGGGPTGAPEILRRGHDEQRRDVPVGGYSDQDNARLEDGAACGAKRRFRNRPVPNRTRRVGGYEHKQLAHQLERGGRGGDFAAGNPLAEKGPMTGPGVSRHKRREGSGNSDRFTRKDR